MWRHNLDLYRAEQGARLDAALYHPRLRTLLINTTFSAETVDGRVYIEQLSEVTPETIRAAKARAVAELETQVEP